MADKATLSPSTLRQLSLGKIILASKSPRRKQIIERDIGLKNVTIQPSGFAEDLEKSMYSPLEYVMETATHKALDVYRSEVDADISPSIVISADTIILCSDTILEKPRGADHHVGMLKMLRDSPMPHQAFTAVCCVVPFDEPVLPGYAMETHLETTSVYFKKNITDEEIIEYVKSGEGIDAAGGYKIQEQGKKFIDKIDGDHSNVVGLPVEGTVKLIEKTIEMARNRPSDDEGSDLEF